MNLAAHTYRMAFVALLSLSACDTSSTKKGEVWDLYDMHNSAARKAGVQTAPRDNDSYYRPPGAYSCNTIADLPSCGSD